MKPSITQILTSRKVYKRLVSVLLAGVFMFGLFSSLKKDSGLSVLEWHSGQIIEEVMAQEDTGAPTTVQNDSVLDSLLQGSGQAIAVFATLFIKLLTGILLFVLHWMGDLMDNTFILEGDIGIKLRSVWVIVRNFVNIFFAMALVGVALLSVVGYSDEGGNYAMKKFIPRMVLALIAVNFTFLAARLVLDINNVLTTAIFAIPKSVTTLADIGPTGTSTTRIFKYFTCLDDKEGFSAAMARIQKLKQRPEYRDVIADLGGMCFAKQPENSNGTSTNPVITLDSAKFNKKDFVWAMATQFQGLNNLNKASQLTQKSFSTLTVNALFSIVFAVIYGTAYVAMFIILIARMVVLWIMIMLSPLAALTIVIPDILPEQLKIKTFIDHAFVPAKMAIPLSFGYILVSQMTVSINTGSAIFAAKSIDLTAGGEFAREISITTIMYGVASVAVIWMGVFAAKGDVIGSGLVDSIKGTVETVGSKVAKAPAYLPIIPTPGGRASLANLQSAAKAVSHKIAQRAELSNARLKERLGLGAATSSVAIKKLEAMIHDAQLGPNAPSHFQSLIGPALTSTSSRAKLEVLMKKVVETDWQNGDASTIASSLGYATFNNMKDYVNHNFDEFLRKASEAMKKAEERSKPVNYADITDMFNTPNYNISNADAFKVDDVKNELRSLKSTDSSTLNDLGIKLEDDDGDGITNSINLSGLSPEKVMTALKSVNLPLQQAYLRSGILEQMAKDSTGFKDALARDDHVRVMILRAKDETNGGDNAKLEALAKLIYNKSLNDLSPQ